MAPSNSELDERVGRERNAHNEDDVLSESYRLKERFRQVFQAPHIRRLNHDWNGLLSEVQDLSVLEYGCGRGVLGLELAKRGAQITGIDISEKYIADANASARYAGLVEDQALFISGDGHRMNFPDDSFDLVIGEGVLHHMDVTLAAREIHRVLKPGGRALFKEPLAGAPWMHLFRWLTPKARTSDERPFAEADLKMLGRLFQVQSSYYGILSPATAAAVALLHPRSEAAALLDFSDWIDQVVAKVAACRSWHQYVLLNLVKKGA